MRSTQLTLLRTVLHAAQAACEHGAAATLDSAHLRALLFERLLEGGCTLLEPMGEPGQGRLLRLDDAVVRTERVALPVPGGGRRRAPRPPDLRIWAPERLELDVHARGTFARPGREAGAVLLQRLARLGRRESDALLLACDRRSYDRLRWFPGRAAVATDDAQGGLARRRRESVRSDGDEPSALRALCAAVLPPSASLGAEPTEHAVEVGRGTVYEARAVVTPMVFGVQRVVAALWLRGGARSRSELDTEALQLDAFAS
ncbi:MAG TPA: hypothetical protein VFS08_04460 [Gemmatimonadaceae bacterium]|nr:hypothetical protein [Gemmatimonadaceae bacterium]